VTLELVDLEVGYGAETTVIDGVDLEVARGELLALLGPNGAGKTTLLKAIDGLVPMDGGTVRVDGTSLNAMTRSERATTIGYLPQAESTTFSPTVFQAVLLGRTPHAGRRPTEADRRRVGAVLDSLGLSSLSMRSIDQLSGGQRQKVKIARLLVQEPSVMLLDEPTASLDLRHKIDVMETIRSRVTDNGAAAVVAAHDLELAARFADSIALLADGRLYDVGPPRTVLTEDAVESVYGVTATIERSNDQIQVTPGTVRRPDPEDSRRQQ
jgi:iron complex transport system ATP-binding protein